MSKIVAKLLFCILILFSSSMFLYSKSVDKYEVISLLSLNIARFTTWPKPDFSHKFKQLNFCLIGDNVIKASFSNIDDMSINRQTIKLIYISRLRNLSQCHVLYVTKLEQSQLIQMLLEIQGQAVLTIGENISFLDAGGMIAFTHQEGKIQINANLTNLQKSGLIISPRLLNLTKIQNRSQVQQLQ